MCLNLAHTFRNENNLFISLLVNVLLFCWFGHIDSRYYLWKYSVVPRILVISHLLWYWKLFLSIYIYISHRKVFLSLVVLDFAIDNFYFQVIKGYICLNFENKIIWTLLFWECVFMFYLLCTIQFLLLSTSSYCHFPHGPVSVVKIG